MQYEWHREYLNIYYNIGGTFIEASEISYGYM
jgi:hypothetical protein